MDSGLLMGLTEGLKSGLTSYKDERDRVYKRDLEQKKVAKEEAESADRLALLKDQRENEKLKMGLKKDEQGNWIQDPESMVIMEKKQKGLLMDAQRRAAEQGIIKTKAETGKILKEGAEGFQKPATADQFKAAGFAKRLEQAESVFNDLGAAGYDRSANKQGLLSFAPNVSKPENLIKQEQGERNFINAVLRRESGAAISPTEFTSAENQYFDRPGDTPDVKAQKKANRMQVYESMKAESGGAYGQIPTVEVPKAGLIGKQAPPKIPSVGSIVEGYRFKGGEPDQQSNWEKVK